MRLSEVLSSPRTTEFIEIDGFMSKKLSEGKNRKISVGKVALTYFCVTCNNTRTFWSGDDLYCIGVTPRQMSIDCVLRCGCGATIAVWFLVECRDGEDTDTDKKAVNNYLHGIAPKVRILRRREKLSEHVRLCGDIYANYTDLLEKSEQAYRDDLGSGAIVYLRNILEQITHQTAHVHGIDYMQDNGKPRPFKGVLEKVDEECHIIPREFSANGYQLFSELSEIVHGRCGEEIALRKFEPLHRLVVGIIENIKNNKELIAAIAALGWNDGGGSNEQA